jgi:hypothetical protein
MPKRWRKYIENQIGRYNMIEIGDRVRYNLSKDFPWFWGKTGIVIDISPINNLIVLFDEVIRHEQSYFDGERKLEMGRGCFEVIENREPDWEI